MSARTLGVAAIAVLAAIVAASCKKTRAPDPSWQPDRSCTSNDDCVAIRSGCCPEPCSSLVVNRRDAQKASERIEAQCKDAPKEPCPVAGSCAGHAYLCVRGECALVMEGSPDWPRPDASPSSEPVDTQAPFDTSCHADDDCVPVTTGCCPAPCGALVVNQRDVARANAVRAAKCRGQHPRCPSAGSCRTHAYLCVRRHCKEVFAGDPDYRERP